MIWLGMMLAMIWAQSVQGWSEWGFRITVLSSLGANLVVSILSGTRRRLASGWLSGWLGQLAKFCLWLARQVAEAATTSAIGSLSLSDASDEEKQVVAFWATFLLLHLGGPDNLTAYSLEDNKISSRKWVEMFYRILGVSYAIYKNTNSRGGGRSWALLPAASVVMLFAGAIKYIETVIALGKGNLDDMQEDASASSSSNEKMELLKSRIKWAKRRWLGDREALLLAQDLFPVWRHALVDSSVDPKSPRQEASEMILSKSDELEWDWKSMCKVAEMELSLIYEFLYTKAILAHTWCYYLIRLLSPLFTAAAAFLFWFWLHIDPQQQQQVRGSYVGITYALLAITLLMDVAWLLRALGSTWAYAYLRDQAPSWLRHQALHASGKWWCSLHRIVVRLDPLQLLCHDPVSQRRWSGTIGRYNLLDECTASTATTCQCPEWWPWSAAGGDRPKEMRYLSKIPPSVKEVLFERVTQILQEAIKKEDGKKEKNKSSMYTRLDIRTKWGQKVSAVVKDKIKLPPSIAQNSNIFGQEFEEDVLLWHIATCMLLPHRQKGKHARAIEVLSEYMMFLVAVRRQMLPGLVLHSQLQITRKTLVEDIWDGGKHRSKFPQAESNKEKLAMILRSLITKDKDTEEQQGDVVIEGTEGTQLLTHAVDLYFNLSGDNKRPESRAAWPHPLVPTGMLEFIFNVWVDKLVYAAVRCSREAHAKQLSAGGDLTTVLWMLIQHAGPFSMGEAPDIILRLPKKEEEKKKPAEEKKPDKEKAKEGEKKPEEEAKPALPWPPLPPAFPPPTTAGIPPWPLPPPMAPCPPPPQYCPVCGSPCYYPSYPPTCPPYCDPSWRPVCPWCPQCTQQHEEPGDEPEES